MTGLAVNLLWSFESCVVNNYTPREPEMSIPILLAIGIDWHGMVEIQHKFSY